VAADRQVLEAPKAEPRTARLGIPLSPKAIQNGLQHANTRESVKQAARLGVPNQISELLARLYFQHVQMRTRTPAGSGADGTTA
jgi:hypothetical protein